MIDLFSVHFIRTVSFYSKAENKISDKLEMYKRLHFESMTLLFLHCEQIVKKSKEDKERNKNIEVK